MSVMHQLEKRLKEDARCVDTIIVMTHPPSEPGVHQLDITRGRRHILVQSLQDAETAVFGVTEVTTREGGTGSMERLCGSIEEAFNLTAQLIWK